MNQDYKQQLADLVYKSDVIDDEKKILWKVFIKEATLEESEAVYGAVSEGSDSLVLLTNYLSDKVAQMKSDKK